MTLAVLNNLGPNLITFSDAGIGSFEKFVLLPEAGLGRFEAIGELRTAFLELLEVFATLAIQLVRVKKIRELQAGDAGKYERESDENEHEHKLLSHATMRLWSIITLTSSFGKVKIEYKGHLQLFFKGVLMKIDIVNTFAEAPSLDRREFFVTSIFAAGTFAAAVMPISAQTKITTDDKGLTAGEVKIPVFDGQIPAYRAMPEKGKKFPVVIVVHEIFGVHEWIQDVCRRFAKLGYIAIAPALYARQGDVKDLKDPRELNMKIFSQIPDTQSMSDLDATLEWAGKNGGDTKRAAITGFCWGGRIVWMYAAHNPKLKAGAAWYGRVVPTPNSPVSAAQPTTPIDHVNELKVPVIGFYGGLDTGIPVDSVQRMQDELKKAGKKSEIIVYPNAKHGFHADYRDSYNKDASVDAWAKLLAWFKKNNAA